MTCSMQPTGCCLKAMRFRAGVYLRRKLWGYSALMAPIRDPFSRSRALSVPCLCFLREGTFSERDSGVAFMKKIVGTGRGGVKTIQLCTSRERIEFARVYYSRRARLPRAPVEHALVMMEAMDAAGKPYEKLLFEKEGHGLYDPETLSVLYAGLSPFCVYLKWPRKPDGASSVMEPWFA